MTLSLRASDGADSSSDVGSAGGKGDGAAVLLCCFVSEAVARTVFGSMGAISQVLLTSCLVY